MEGNSPIVTQTNLSKKESYFSRLFSGRINRATYQEGAVVIGITIFIIGLVILFGLSLLGLPHIGAVASIAFMIIFAAFYGLSLEIRRAHDLNMTGKQLLPNFLLYLLSPLIFIGLTIFAPPDSADQFKKILINYAQNPYIYILSIALSIFSYYISFRSGKKTTNNYGPPTGYLSIRQTFNTVLGVNIFPNANTAEDPKRLIKLLLKILIGLLAFLFLFITVVLIIGYFINNY